MPQGQSGTSLTGCFGTASSRTPARSEPWWPRETTSRSSSGSPPARPAHACPTPPTWRHGCRPTPRSTLAVPGVGKAAHDLISCAKTQLASVIPAAQLQQVEAALGTNLEDYLDFLGDVAIGGSWRRHEGARGSCGHRYRRGQGCEPCREAADGRTARRLGRQRAHHVDRHQGGNHHRHDHRLRQGAGCWRGDAGRHVAERRGRQRSLLPRHRRFRGRCGGTPEGGLAGRHGALHVGALGDRRWKRRELLRRHRRDQEPDRGRPGEKWPAAGQPGLHDQYQALSRPAGPPDLGLHADGRRLRRYASRCS